MKTLATRAAAGATFAAIALFIIAAFVSLGQPPDEYSVPLLSWQTARAILIVSALGGLAGIGTVLLEEKQK